MASSMTSVIRLAPEGCPTASLHLLPCCIQHNGEAPVSRFFHPHLTGEIVEGIPIEEAAFRGRALSGSKIVLPDSYQGFVLEREPVGAVTAVGNKSNGAAGRSGDASGGGALSHDLHEVENWAPTHTFAAFTYWNRETVPTQADLPRRALHLLNVAAAVQMPVSPTLVLERVEKSRSRQS